MASGPGQEFVLPAGTQVQDSRRVARARSGAIVGDRVSSLTSVRDWSVRRIETASTRAAGVSRFFGWKETRRDPS